MEDLRSPVRRRQATSLVIAVLAALSLTVKASAADTDQAQLEFFEKSIRPILVERCLGCHGPSKQKGGLRLDSRQAVLLGGSSGPAVVPGDPTKSLLVDAVNYGELYQMPPKSKLPASEIEALTTWVTQGAHWGVESRSKETRSTGGKTEPATSMTALDSPGEFARRARFWSFQPIRRSTPATVGEHSSWSRNPIDQYLLSAMRQRQLSPAPEADRRTLIRRLSFDLIGLPPTPEDVASYLADDAPNAYERVVDRLLASPQYGERWGRHWLDLVRYAETAGHEFDYDTLNAYRYRDYVIRALNADIPYDQFVIEQLAGDLLEAPRRHPATGTNESILGTGFYFLGEGTHSPVDVREDQCRRVDNQIEVMTKTFLGLTVTCARCHDHKFDPIRATDYYALAGYLTSSRHQQAFLDEPAQLTAPQTSLREAKSKLHATLKEALPLLPEDLRKDAERTLCVSPDPSPIQKADAFATFNQGRSDGWLSGGNAFDAGTNLCGDFRLSVNDSGSWLIPVRPGVVHSGLLSDRLQGVLRSPSFTISQRWIHYLAAGKEGRINLVIDGFEKIRDPIYGGLSLRVGSGDHWQWFTQDVSMWLGHRAYIELSDGATADYNGSQTRMGDGRGFIAVDTIRMSDERLTTPTTADPPPVRLETILKAIEARDSTLAQKLQASLEEFRAIEASIPEPTLGMAIADGPGSDERLLIRGNHRNPGDVVPRRFLDVLGGGTPPQGSVSAGSGRMDLARRMVDPHADPLLPRVLVNRLWRHHFGEGLVKSVDDFGAMGQPPSHPELLDWLASELISRGWSIKSMQRLLVTTAAYRMSSQTQAEADRLDPNNTYLHRMNVRRLEGEAIRDLLLTMTGRLDITMFGPAVPTYLSPFMEGRGRPSRSGPLDGDSRRSIYLNVRRNFLNPMFLAFDAPVPFSTMGRRHTSNVPAQALTLLNDPLVLHLASLWAKRLLESPASSDAERINKLFEAAFSRPPSEQELDQCLEFVRNRKPDLSDTDRQEAWSDLCHVLINVKSFIYVD